MKNKEDDLVRGLNKGNINSYKTIFNNYYEKLFQFALRYVYHKEIAEEIVQDVFIIIWEKRKELNITDSLSSYLFTSVKNRSISYLRSKLSKVELSADDHSILKTDNKIYENSIEFSELEKEIHNAISLLPERCKLIFNLSRNSGLTYKQIAFQLNISPESVKTQIGIALKRLKLHLEKNWETISR